MKDSKNFMSRSEAIKERKLCAAIKSPCLACTAKKKTNPSKIRDTDRVSNKIQSTVLDRTDRTTFREVNDRPFVCFKGLKKKLKKYNSSLKSDGPSMIRLFQNIGFIF